MSELLSNLGINWKILLAQIINFAILLFILQRFLYKPIISLLDKRQKEIAKAHEDAKATAAKLADADTEKEKRLAEARRQSETLIKQAEADAAKAAERIIADTKSEMARVSKEERTKMTQEKDKLMQEATRSLGETVAMAVEKSVGDILDAKSREKLVEQALKTAQHKLAH